METDAKIIVRMIMAESTETRGLLFKCISEELILQSQGYTGRLFKKMANEYGYREFKG